MRFHKRLLFVLFAVAAGGIGLTSPSRAVDAPVAVIVVPCESDTPVSSVTEAPAGVYIATVVGICTPDKDFEWGPAPVGTPCSTTTTGSIPCVTADIDNLPGLACWTALSAMTVSTCGPTTSITPSTCTTATFTVTVDGQCLSTVPGVLGQVTHGGGVFTARFQDDIPAADNFGFFLVVIRPAV